MRVLYFCPEYYYRHGGRTHARGFFAALRNLPNVSNSVLYPREDPLNKTETGPRPEAGRERLWFLPETLRQVIKYFVPRNRLTRALIAEIRQHRIDALVIRTGIIQPCVRSLKRACPQTTVCLEINSAFFDETLPNLPFRSLFQRWEARRFDAADAITVVSSYLKTYLEARGIASDKILVNHNGVNPEAIDLHGVSGVRPAYGIPAEAFVVGYIGGMESFRRLPEVVGYLAEIRRRGHDDVYCVIVGDGADMPAIRSARALHAEVLGDTVKLAGWKEHAKIPAFLATFDVAIFPFTNDYCSPLKLFEYVGAGLPTIGPDTSAVKEVFEDGIHLRLVKQDGSDFIQILLELKNDAALRGKLSRTGRGHVLEEFTWARNAERVVQHIQRARTNS